MKQILKNLWSQRAQNVWLFAELVVVCFVAWTQMMRDFTKRWNRIPVIVQREKPMIRWKNGSLRR